jgi:hypothetical protein
MTAPQQVGQILTAADVIPDAVRKRKPMTQNFTATAQSATHRVLVNYLDDGLLAELAIVTSGLGLVIGDELVLGQGAGLKYVVIELELLSRNRRARRYRAVAALKPLPDGHESM